MTLAIAIVVIVLSLGFGLLAAMANGMSDAPTGDRASLRPMWIGLMFAAAILVGRHFGW